MAHKSSFVFLLCLLFPLSLAACKSTTAAPPNAYQNAISTIVAATVQAAFSATQLAFEETQSTPLIPPTPLPAQPNPTRSIATPTLLPLSTYEFPTDQALRIAYTKDGNVYLWTAGDGSKALADSYDAVKLRISDDGAYIAYQRQDAQDPSSQELWVVNTNGYPNPRLVVSSAELKEITPPNPDAYIMGAGVLDFIWRPNTHELAYNTLILHEGPGFGPNYDMRLVNADTLTKSTLFNTGEGGMFYYSPDGSQVALSNPDHISLANADGSNPRENVLTYPYVSTHSEYLYTPHPIWASDSGSLRVAIPPEETLADPLPPTGLWLIPVDGSPAELLGNVQAIPFAWPDNAFAPDLEHVIYVTPVGVRTENQRELRIANPDGSNEVAYDNGASLEFISWSPDSRHFLYQINGATKKGVYMGGLNTQPKLIVWDPDVIQDISWLGGNRLVFLFQDGDQWQLLIHNLRDDAQTRVDTLPDTDPVFVTLP